MKLSNLTKDNYKIRGILTKIWKSGCIQEGVNLIAVSFYEGENQYSIQIEDSAPEGEIISNQAPEGAISTMVVINGQMQ